MTVKEMGAARRTLGGLLFCRIMPVLNFPGRPKGVPNKFNLSAHKPPPPGLSALGGQCVESLRQSRERRERRDRLLRLRGLARQSTPPRPARLRNRSRRSNGRGQGEAFGL
jgi:hypothetical protein